MMLLRALITTASGLALCGCFAPNQSTATEGESEGTVDDGSGTQDSESSDPEESESVSESESQTADDTTGTGDTGSSGTGGSEDMEVPAVVSVSPMDGSTGVAADAIILIEFSEPMDTAQTELAFESATLPPVTFAWSNGDTVLEVTPIDSLEYASGNDPDSVEAQSYSFLVGTGARDVAGNALEQSVSTSFTTLRVITEVLEDDSASSGRVNSAGETGTSYQAGDSATTSNQYKIVTSIPLAVPTEIVAFESAALRGEQIAPVGTPYVDLGGELYVRHIAYTTFDASIFASAVYANLGVISEDETAEVKTIDATDAVRNTFFGENAVEAADSIQFRMEFGVADDGENDTDRAAFTNDGFELEVVYLIP